MRSASMLWRPQCEVSDPATPDNILGWYCFTKPNETRQGLSEYTSRGRQRGCRRGPSSPGASGEPVRTDRH